MNIYSSNKLSAELIC